MLTQPTPGLLAAGMHTIDTVNRLSAVEQVPGTYAQSITWPTANLAIYVPVRVTSRVVVVKLFVLTNTTGTGNFDLGVYDSGGTRLSSTGATAKLASQTAQVVDVTDFTLGPGLYYMAHVDGTNTATYVGTTIAAPNPAANGVLTEALGSIALPATATWAVDNTLALVPGMGMLTDTTVT